MFSLGEHKYYVAAKDTAEGNLVQRLYLEAEDIEHFRWLLYERIGDMPIFVSSSEEIRAYGSVMPDMDLIDFNPTFH